MRVAVCVKEVPAPGRPLGLDPRTGLLDRTGDSAPDPIGDVAVEAGLRLAEASGGTVTAITMGPQTSADAVRRALAMGADEAVVVSDPALSGADVLVTAKVLAAVIAGGGFELAVAGEESSDASTGLLPAALAALLAWPALTRARSLEWDGEHLTVGRLGEGCSEVMEAELPAVISVTMGLHRPRYPSVAGIRDARRRPVEVRSLVDVGIDPSSWDHHRQRTVGLAAAQARPEGEVLADIGDGGQRIVRFLAGRGLP